MEVDAEKENLKSLCILKSSELVTIPIFENIFRPPFLEISQPNSNTISLEISVSKKPTKRKIPRKNLKSAPKYPKDPQISSTKLLVEIGNKWDFCLVNENDLKDDSRTKKIKLCESDSLVKEAVEVANLCMEL